MAINQSDISIHSNPNLAVVSSDFVKGGFRTGVATKDDLYTLSGKTDEPSAAGQLKEYATIVYVSGETKYYVLTDVDNVDNAAGWEEFQTGGGTLTGATSGLHLISSGTSVALGGDLTGSTTIGGGGLYDLTLNNINDFQVTPSGSSAITFGIDETGLLFTFTGGSISYDSNQGIVYGGDYSTNYINESLVSKRYVDTIAAGLHPKTAVLVATTGETLTLSGLTTIDGISLSNGDRVLAKDQSNPIDNGIYIVTGITWSRSSDFDGSPEGEVEQGALIPVITGNTLQNSQWILITKDPVVGVSALTFTLFSSGAYVDGIGIDISGNVINVDGASLDGNSLLWSGNTFNVDTESGTLSTALGTKLNITDFGIYSGATQTTIGTKLDEITFNTYTGDTQPVIDNALTGVTNIGTGEGVYSGTSGNTALLRTVIGSGDTIISTVGNDIIIYSTSGGSDQYTGESPAAIEVGGIGVGTVLTGKSYTELWEELLVPELCGTVTAPSLGIGLTHSGIREIGCNVSQTVTGTFNQGCINPQYCSLSDKRSGLPNAYSFTGTGMPAGFQACTNLIASAVNASYSVVSGSQSWGVCTRYDCGCPALGSKGTEYCAALVSGCTAPSSASITGILPWYWGTYSSGTITSAIITGGTKTVANVTASTPITFNATTEYLWFAAPTGAYTTKTKWWVCAANAGDIGGTGNLWAASCLVAVTSGQGCWSGCNFDVYVTCGITSTATGVPMCLYY